MPPPAEKRIAIGGAFLDEVSIRIGPTASVSFPAERHQGTVGADGVVAIRAQMPSVVQLFAEGRLTPIGGAPVEVSVGGKNLGPMVLARVESPGPFGSHEIALLLFRRPSAAVPR